MFALWKEPVITPFLKAMETNVILLVGVLATLGTVFFLLVCRGETGWGFISVSSHGPDANEKAGNPRGLELLYIHIFLYSNIPIRAVVGHPAMGLGFPFFPVHKAECPSPPLSADPKGTEVPEDRSQHLAHSEPMNSSIATGCHVAGKIPGTFGVEVRGLREKPEASRAFSHRMDESRAAESCHIAKYVKSWHI